jgi:ATP-dependent exoDNAse (exonuclease V) beta subunit
MTVHGSKGLQFDHVFLIGMNKSNVQRSGAFFFDGAHGVFSLKIPRPSDGKYKFPAMVESMVEAEKEEMQSESKRLLYVAMTRAKRSLTLLGSKKLVKNSQSPSWMRFTIDYIEKAGLEDLFIEQDSIQQVEKTKCTEYTNEHILEFFKWSGWPVYKKKTETAVTGEKKIKVYENVLEEKFSDLASNIKEGVLFHEFMESIEARSFKERGVPKNLNSEPSIHEKAVDYLFEQGDFPFSEVLEHGHKEWGFDLKTSDVRASGKIDLWAQLGSDVWIVDYKTGSLKNSSKGFEQLHAYKKVIEKYVGQSVKSFNLVLTFPYDRKTLIQKI